MKRLRIAFVASLDSTFIQRDRELLQRFAAVRDVRWTGIRSIPRLAWAVMRSDAAFAWFALDHAYGACRLARLFRRKSFVVVGGVDVANVPELGYGAHIDPRTAARSRYALLHSDRILVVDDSLREEIARNAAVRRPEIVTVPLGFDTDFFSPAGGPRQDVLTVGYVTDVNVRRKGLETFVKAARSLPDLPFVLVGRCRTRPRIVSAKYPPRTSGSSLLSPFATSWRHTDALASTFKSRNTKDSRVRWGRPWPAGASRSGLEPPESRPS